MARVMIDPEHDTLVIVVDTFFIALMMSLLDCRRDDMLLPANTHSNSGLSQK
jgi:hypothetical protein